MRNAHQWIDQVLKELFTPDNRRIQAWVDSLIEKNKQFVGNDVHVFMYAGSVYRASNLVGRIPPGKVVLHSSLHAEMEDLLASQKAVTTEMHRVGQVLFQLLEPCQVEQDIRDTLPECLVDCLPDLKRWPRKREPAYTVASNPRAVRQYEKMLPKMQEYSVARMIF